jgi:NADPH:quinone reductase-like Zn-dependent oxidoreductase
MKAAVLVSYGMDFRVTDVLRPQPRPDEVFVRIAASGVNPPDTRTFGGTAVHARHAPPAILGLGPIQRGVSKPGFNFNLDDEGNGYVRSTCN